MPGLVELNSDVKSEARTAPRNARGRLHAAVLTTALACTPILAAAHAHAGPLRYSQVCQEGFCEPLSSDGPPLGDTAIQLLDQIIALFAAGPRDHEALIGP